MILKNDYDKLLTGFIDALLRADLKFLENNGLQGHFPYLGPNGLADRNTSGMMSHEKKLTPPFYNPNKGYVSGIFMQEYTNKEYAEIENHKLIPIKQISIFEKLCVKEFQCNTCGSFASLAQLIIFNVTWGRFLAYDGIIREIFGQINLTINNLVNPIYSDSTISCEEGHFSLGYASIGYAFAPVDDY